MANKRMFSRQITDSDAFVDMPATSQLLYFHLNMQADDDGFVSNPKRIIRMINVGDDDMKILLAKRFLLPFENGVVVIKHWLLHNAVRKDMYKETQYLEEKKQLQIKDNLVYTEVRNESVTSPLHRLGQVRLDKDRLDKTIYGEFDNVFLLREEYEKLIKGIGEPNTKLLIEELSGYMASKKKKYDSHYATIKNWARRRVIENSNSKRGKGIIL